MLGPLLPTLAQRWSLNDIQSGYLVAAQFIGSLTGTLASGFFLSQVAFRRTMILGVALMALGVATLMSGSYLVGLGAAFCYGTGIGITSPAANLLVARASGQQRASSLNLLNFFWSLGAVSCPFLLAVFLHGNDSSLFFTVLAGVLGLLIVALLAGPIGMPNNEVEREATQLPSRSLSATMLLVYGTVFFVYVGTESALGAWLASYAKRSSTAPGEGWITVPAYFYGALLAGRLAGAVSLRRISETTQARLGALLATTGVLALLASGGVTAIAISSAVVGLGLSTLYPIAIGIASAGLGSAAPRVMGGLFALSTLGGACLPWLVGYVSTQVGSLRVALVVPLLGCLMMAALYWVPVMTTRHP